MEKKLYKSRTDKMLAGVCGGIAEYFSVDPVIVRLIVVVFTLAGGAGLIGYIIGAIIIPASPMEINEDEVTDGSRDPVEKKMAPSPRGSGMRIFGVILLALAALLALRQFAWIPGELIIIVVFVILGVYLILKKPA